jgi:hypothetical protein
MRASAVVWIALTFPLAGCCGSCESPTSSGVETKASAKVVCTDGDCCSIATRSAILQQSLEAKDDPHAIQLKTVKFDPFLKDVKAQNGKVVCLYPWANHHAPSKKHLPDVIALQHKFGKDGLVCMTVSMDQGEARKGTLPYLQKHKCDLVNFLQAEGETVEAWDAVFGCCGIPSVVIYGRNGKQAASFMMADAPIDLASIEKALVKELNAK